MDDDISQNVAYAIRYAKSNGIRYLFVDFISLDQKSPDLILRVKQFSNLYATIPVIAAYDHPALDFYDTFLRPWIYSELKLMIHNPYKIVYVGHKRYQGTHLFNSVSQLLLGWQLRSQSNDTFFAAALKHAWQADFVTTILGVLAGFIHMEDIHDFKLILPEFAGIFAAAEILDRNDYLLLVALIATASMRVRPVDPRVCFSFARLSYTTFTIYPLWNSYDVYLSGHRIASLFCGNNRLQVIPEVQRHIFDMLGLGPKTFKEFLRMEKKVSARLGKDGAGKKPDVDAVYFKARG